MKRIISILFILLVLCGCTTPKVTDGEVIIDLTQEFDVNTILENVKEDTEVSYELDKENSKIIISLTRNNETETLEKEVTILEPQYTIKDDIKFNPYLDYNINDFITVDEGVKINHTVDTKTSKITFNLSKGIWSKTVEKEFTIDSLFDFSNVGEYGALIFERVNWVNRMDCFKSSWFNSIPEIGCVDVIVFAKNHTGLRVEYFGQGGVPVECTFTWDEDGNIIFDNKVNTPFFGANMNIEFYENFFCDDGVNTTFTLNSESNLLKVYGHNKVGEYLDFELKDNFVPPYNTKEYYLSKGKTIEEAWLDGKKIADVWYEPFYENYEVDYTGVKTFANRYYND